MARVLLGIQGFLWTDVAGEEQFVNGLIVISVWVFHMIPQADGGQLVQVSSKETKTTAVTEQNDLSSYRSWASKVFR